ncbi:MAG TPA: NAD-dependent epimerase/dehydratase family protein [Thermodesulfovibrionales bacterium]|nr:NAD-dependent epimerase/dehydratase family protein [Thermodesulfovibrionales bacterium]
MKALVTGATGFIGSHLVDELLKRGYEVACLVRRTSDLRWLDGLGAAIVYGDCESPDSLRDLAVDYDYVFHLAGLTKAKKDEDFFSANVKGTENLLRIIAAGGTKLKRFLYLSSLAAVGPGNHNDASGEVTKANPVSSYGKSKLEAERVTLRYEKEIPVTILRPPAVYGPRDRDLFLFFKMIGKGFYPYWGKCYYSFLYVEDLVKGMVLAAEAEKTRGRVYFLSDSKVYSNEEIVTEIAEVLQTKATKLMIPKGLMTLFAAISAKLTNGASIINRDKVKELNQSQWVCHNERAEREFGFIPKVMVKEGIKWTADWYRIHQWL